MAKQAVCDKNSIETALICFILVISCWVCGLPLGVVNIATETPSEKRNSTASQHCNPIWVESSCPLHVATVSVGSYVHRYLCVWKTMILVVMNSL